MNVTAANAVVFDPARRAFFYFRINRDSNPQTISFVDANGNPYTINDKTWQFNIKRRAQDSANVLQLLSGSGLTIGTSSITIAATAAQTASIDALTHYAELYNVTDKQTWLCGPAAFHNGEFDAGDGAATITITIGSSAGGGAWGEITGTLADQTDLQDALDAKLDDTDEESIISSAQRYTLSAIADADYTVLLTDAIPLVKMLVMNASTARAVTLPNNTTAAIPTGYPIAFLNIGVGTVTVSAEAGATVENYSGTFTIPPSSMATFTKRATNTWRLENVTPAVPTSRTIAGVDLADDITASELLAALGGWTKVTTTTDFSTTSTSFVDVDPASGPSLEFPVTSGVLYEFRMVVHLEPANVSEGGCLSVNGPTLTSLKYRLTWPVNATSGIEKNVSAYDTGSSSTATANSVAEIHGFIETSASGNVIARLLVETGGNAVVVKAKSYVEYRIA